MEEEQCLPSKTKQITAITKEIQVFMDVSPYIWHDFPSFSLIHFGLALKTIGRPRGTVGKASASDARGPGFEPPWLVQRSRWESRPLSLVGNGAGAVTHPTDRAGTIFPRGTDRFLVKKGVHIASFCCLSDETLSHPLADLAKKDSVLFVTEEHQSGPAKRGGISVQMRNLYQHPRRPPTRPSPGPTPAGLACT